MERFLKILLILLLGHIIFLYGAVSTELKIFPYTHIKDYIGVFSYYYKIWKIDDNSNAIRWVNEMNSETGVVRNQNAEVFAGYTLYTSTHDTTARLVDINGQVVHSWSVNYNDVWTNQDTIPFNLDEQYFYLRDFHLYENGDIVLLLSASGVSPWGVGLVKLDSQSNVLWKYTAYTNNDFHVAPNGKIYTIVHHVEKDVKFAQTYDIPERYLEDNIAILDQDGNLENEISLIKALQNSAYDDLLKKIRPGEWDMFHTNSIETIPTTNPSVPWLKQGALLLSIRNLNAFVVLDPATERIIYAESLKTQMQHDLDYLENGNLMVFDNQGGVTDGGTTRILEIEPTSQTIEWMYEEYNQDKDFETIFWGTQQKLDNGNVLIAEAEDGRLLEVTPEKEIVWEYYTPLFKEIEGRKKTAILTHAQRIKYDDVQFIDR